MYNSCKKLEGELKFILDIFLHNATSSLQLWHYKCSFIWKTPNQDTLKNSLIICQLFEKLLTSSLQVWRLEWHHVSDITFMNAKFCYNRAHLILFFFFDIITWGKNSLFLNLRLEFLHHKACLIFYIECNYLFLLLIISPRVK